MGKQGEKVVAKESALNIDVKGSKRRHETCVLPAGSGNLAAVSDFPPTLKLGRSILGMSEMPAPSICASERVIGCPPARRAVTLAQRRSKVRSQGRQPQAPQAGWITTWQLNLSRVAYVQSIIMTFLAGTLPVVIVRF